MEKEYIPPSIAFIRLSSLGDVIMTTPLYREVKRRSPGTRVSVITKERYAGLLAGNPHVDEVLPFEDRGRHGGLTGLVSFSRSLRSRTFDLLVDLHGSLRSRLLCLLLRKKRMSGYDKGRTARRIMVRNGPGAVELASTVDRYFGALGLTEFRSPVPELFVPSGDRVSVEKETAPFRTKGRLVGLNTGARWDTKKWPLEHWRELVNLLVPDVDILLFGDPTDRPGLERIREETGVTLPVVSMTEAAGLGRTMGYLALCDAVVSVDSGPMHMAEALSVPVVALFGPTHPCLGFAPTRMDSVVLCHNLFCSPCSLHGKKPCRYGTRACLKEIVPDEVRKTIDSIFNREQR